MIEEKSYTVVEEIVTGRHDHITIQLLNNGIVFIKYGGRPEIKEITMDDIRDSHIAFESICEGLKMKVYIETAPFINANKEVLEYTKTKESVRYTKARAVLVDNLAKKILYNFYLTIKKPPVPIKAFKTRESAFNWLEAL